MTSVRPSPISLDFKDQKVYSDHGTKFDKRGAYDLESVPFYTVDEKFPFGHGEKSVFLINEHMHLTRDEALAIRFHMGDFTDRNTSKVYTICPLALPTPHCRSPGNLLRRIGVNGGIAVGCGNCCVFGRYEGLYYIDNDDFHVFRRQTPRRMTAREPA